MTKLKKMIESCEEVVYPVTTKGRLVQKEQIKLKNDLTLSLMEDMKEIGIEVYPVQKGFVIVIPNNEEGVIPVEVNIITKPLDYDYIALHEEYLDKLNKK